jgi:hypothetical protein
LSTQKKTTNANKVLKPCLDVGKPDREKKRPYENAPNKRHKEDFERLLDDAVLGVKRK